MTNTNNALSETSGSKAQGTNNQGPNNQDPSARANIVAKFVLTRNLTFVFFAGLIVLFVVGQILRPQGINWVILLAQISPLLAFVPGLRSQYYRAFSWLCFLMLLYFVAAVMESLASTATVSDYVFLFLTVAIFSTSMMCSRYAQRVQKNIIT